MGEFDYIDIAETARLTGMKPAQLAQLRHRGTGPRFYKPTPRTVRYRRSEVLAWLGASPHTQTGTPVSA